MVSRNRRSLVVLAAALSLLLAAAPAGSQAADGPEAAPDELLVGFEPGTSSGDRAQARRSNDARLIEVVVAEDTGRGVVERVSIPDGSDRNRYERRFESDPNVAYAEPNWKLDIVATSDDPYYTGGHLWGMYGDTTSPSNQYGSQAGEAWASGNVGSNDVWVGVIDQGIQYYHPDLDANVGPNPGETGLDSNGDDKATNGTGVVGVNWNVRMLSGKFLGPMGGYTSDAVKAVDYFTDLKVNRGLNVVATNNSWGGGGYSDTLYAAIREAGKQGILFVAAAGNSGDDTDVSPSYPASYDLDNIISVAALRSDGTLASWSNYGDESVDLAAPGAGVYSTVPDGYASFSGTSMAAPHVAGAAALHKAANPDATMAGIRDAIFAATVATDSVKGKVLTNGRLDVSSFFASVTGAPPEATTTSASTGEDQSVDITLVGTDAETCDLTFAIVSGPSNGAPTANDDVVDAVVGVQVSFNVLANDTDVDGDSLAIQSTSTADLVGTLDCTISTGDCTYVTDTFVGTTSFSYVAADPDGATVTGTFDQNGSVTSVSCTTDGSGACPVTGRFNSKHGTSVTFTVTDVSAAGHVYDESGNVETSITVSW